ncbi:MAG TPA: M20/M25/M40 family metallo-hydrolase [Planctomycetota bacterium]
MIGTVLLLALAAQDPASQDPAVAAARDWLDGHQREILAELVVFSSIPNVAADSENIRRNADWIVAGFRSRGVECARLPVPGASDAPPAVVGWLPSAGATRTLAFYAHYDGQPVDPTAWTDLPWRPTLRDAALPGETLGRRIELGGRGAGVDPEYRLYARGVADDKAPIVAMLAALDAMAAAGIRPTANLLFFFEGEEEAGSPHLRELLVALAEEHRPDAWLFCDGPVHQSRRPQVVFGVRGITSLDVTLYGAERWLHSGHYGNWAPNPALELARLLAGMKDDAGRVLIEGFYADVAPIGPAERAAIAALPQTDAALLRELGLAAAEGGGSLAERLLLPSLNVRGLSSASVGESARNVVPPWATASIDFRLVKGCVPERMLERIEAHVRAQGYHVVRTEPDHATRLEHAKIARIERGGGYRAARTPMGDPFARAVVRAAERAAGGPVVQLPTLGGSLPLYLFEEIFAVPVVVAPIANHDDNQHAPDENLRLANLFSGIELMAALFTME